MFVLKKIISGFFLPLTVLLGLSGLGLVMLFSGRRQGFAKKMLALTLLILVLLSYGTLSSWPLKRLESVYTPIDIVTARSMGIKWVVVLAGGNDETYVRMAEGIRIYRALPGTKLIVSGGKVVDAAPEPSSSKMARIAEELGVDPKDIVQENLSRDTKDEARIVKSMIHESPFVLVTSAYHMPRSMALFETLGMRPIPAPTGYHKLPEVRYLSPNMFFPNAGNIEEAEIVLHEVFGIISARLMGQIGVGSR